MKVIVHLCRWSPAAGADAFDFFQRKQSVGRGAFVADAQFLRAVLQNLFPAATMQLILVQTCTLNLPRGLVVSIE